MLLDSMELSKKSMGAASMGYSVAASRLARFYQGYKNDFARAEPLLTEVVRITRNMFGDEHPFYARSLTDLGDLYREMGDYGRAESILRDALSISKRGRRSGEGGDPGILKDLGLLYWSKGDYVRAEPFLREALEIDKKAKGEDPTPVLVPTPRPRGFLRGERRLFPCVSIPGRIIQSTVQLHERFMRRPR